MPEVVRDGGEGAKEGYIGRGGEIAQNTLGILELKQRVIDELHNPGFPDLDFLFSDEALAVACDILEELATSEENTFKEVLETEDEKIIFKIFERNSLFEYYFSLLRHFKRVNASDRAKEIMVKFTPRYKDFKSKQYQSSRYYKMLCYALENLQLDNNQKRVLEIQKDKGRNLGVHLDDETKEKVRSLQSRLVLLAEEFDDNIKKAAHNISFVIEDAELLQDMPENLLSIGKNTAENFGNRGLEFHFNGANVSALLAYCDSPEIRKHVFLTSCSLAHDENTEIVLEILRLRKQLAELFGYKRYSDKSLSVKMAESSEQIIEIYRKNVIDHRGKLESDISVLKEHFGISEVNHWDFEYYKRKYLEDNREIDDSEFQKYREYESVLSGMFFSLEKVFGIHFEAVEMKTYHPDVKVYLVTYKGRQLGYYMPDFFHNPNKAPGAWAEPIRKSVTGNKIVTNVSNFPKSVDGPTYLSFENIRTMFHELGHMCHELLSPKNHQDFGGLGVEADAVEAPSALFENLRHSPELQLLYLKHEETRESIGRGLIESLQSELDFGATKKYVSRIEKAIFDLYLHDEIVPNSKQEMQRTSFEIYQECYPFSGNYMGNYSIFASFDHLFDESEPVYAAGYYSYYWSHMIQEKIWKKIKEAGSIFENPQIERYLEYILSQGRRKPSQELFDDFMS